MQPVAETVAFSWSPDGKWLAIGETFPPSPFTYNQVRLVPWNGRGDGSGVSSSVDAITAPVVAWVEISGIEFFLSHGLLLVGWWKRAALRFSLLSVPDGLRPRQGFGCWSLVQVQDLEQEHDGEHRVDEDSQREQHQHSLKRDFPGIGDE